MPAKARKSATPRYLYVATLKETGEIVTMAADGLAVAGTDSREVREMGDERVRSWNEEGPRGAPAGTLKVVRYVLESSVRPGGS